MPILDPAQAVEQQPVVVLVARSLAREASRAHSRSAAERVHFDPRVLREKHARRAAAVKDGFQNGILFEGGAGLFRWLDAGHTRQGFDFQAAPEFAKFTQFSLIAGGDVQLHASFTTLFCTSTSPAMPAWA